MFKNWKKSKNESDRMEYYAARKRARKAVRGAQEVERKRFGDRLVKKTGMAICSEWRNRWWRGTETWSVVDVLRIVIEM